MGWTCGCGASNVARQRTCEACGTERQKATGSKYELDLRCGWVNVNTQRCLAGIDGWLGNSGPPLRGQRAGFCWWHERCLTLEWARFAGDYAAFEEFWQSHCGPLARPPYCDIWSHYPPEYHWELLQGRPPAFRLPDPCASKGCPFRPIPSELLTGTPAEHLQRVTMLLASAPLSQPIHR